MHVEHGEARTGLVGAGLLLCRGKTVRFMQPVRGERPHSTDPAGQDLPVVAMCAAGFLALAAAFGVTLLDPLVGVTSGLPGSGERRGEGSARPDVPVAEQLVQRLEKSMNDGRSRM
jgi:hypothetical protein